LKLLKSGGKLIKNWWSFWRANNRQCNCLLLYTNRSWKS